MRNPLDAFRNNMIPLQIERDGNTPISVSGLKNIQNHTNKKMFQFYPDTDIQPGDWILEPVTQMRYYIADVDLATFQGQIYSKNAFYLTASEYETSNHTAHPNIIYHISNPQNSIIGNQSNPTININCTEDFAKLIELNGGDDKKELQEIIALLESIQSGQIQPKKGIFSKFSNLVSKHSWFMDALNSWLINWFFN